MTKIKKNILLGPHLSIAGGVENAYYRAQSIGATAVQFFTHSNRQWHMKDITQAAQVAVSLAQKETGIIGIVHSSYLINLGSQSADTVKKSIITLAKELQHCDDLGVDYLVLHPGGGLSSEQDCITQIAHGLVEALSIGETRAHILLETMAGQGSQVGHRFENLAGIKNNVAALGNSSSLTKRVEFCVDTCHIWAAGYDISNEKAYHKVWHEFDTILGLKHLQAIHLNDSKKECGTRVDRHAEIGEGVIGLEAFRLLMNDSHLKNVPKILETPKKELSDYAHNMALLLDLVK